MKVLYLCLFFTSLFFACKKNSDTVSLKPSTYNYIYNYLSNPQGDLVGADTNIYHNGRLTLRKALEPSTGLWPSRCVDTFYYNTNGKVIKVERRKFNYAINKFEDTCNSYWEFSYPPNRIVVTEHFRFLTSEAWRVAINTIHLNTEGIPDYSLKVFTAGSNTTVDSGFYNYVNKNLVSYKSRVTGSSSPGFMKETIMNYQGYDQHQNPFKGYYFLIGMFDKAWSESNYTSIKKETHEYLNGVYQPLSTDIQVLLPWTFTYNSLGYPVTANSSTGFVVNRFTYE